MNQTDDCTEVTKIPAKPNRSAIFYKVMSKIITVLFIVFMVFFLYSAISSKGENGVSLGPYKIFNVLTGSMEPTINRGSLIISKHIPENKLAVGDIITYKIIEGSNSLVTHRIVSINEIDNSFITQGDANNIEDNTPVLYSHIIGKVVFFIPLLGLIMGFLRTPYGLIFCILLILIIELIKRIIKPSDTGGNGNEKFTE